MSLIHLQIIDARVPIAAVHFCLGKLAFGSFDFRLRIVRRGLRKS